MSVTLPWTTTFDTSFCSIAKERYWGLGCTTCAPAIRLRSASGIGISGTQSALLWPLASAARCMVIYPRLRRIIFRATTATNAMLYMLMQACPMCG